MASCNLGKKETVDWIRTNYPNATILDIGACDGKWRDLLPEYTMDAVEIYKPNAEKLTGYREVFTADIRTLAYGKYDLLIFGDIIAHLSVKDAQSVLKEAEKHCKDYIIAVPWLYEQGAIGGNPHEIHVQDDLTAELFTERYPQCELLYDTGKNYCYYHLKKKEVKKRGKRDKSL